jgi:hypothetical protein
MLKAHFFMRRLQTMLDRIRPMTSLVLLASASALVGCASVPPTAQWATSNGFQRTELGGREYFCRQQTAVGTNPRSAGCLTLNQLSVIRWAGPINAQGFLDSGSASMNTGREDYYLSNTLFQSPVPP